ncbi:MAG TPA: hypothetical protein DCS93_20445 [Microscillaceae bacterium]|nr:hypothetical protein [Microscillaceae bacterium]
MDQSIIDIVNQEFSTQEAALVIDALSSINLNHIMAQSKSQLKYTKLSILKLAKGDLDEVIDLTEKAKIDFRDILYWASLQE